MSNWIFFVENWDKGTVWLNYVTKSWRIWLLSISALYEYYWRALYCEFSIDLYVLLFCSSPGIMLLIFARTTSHVPLKILSIEDGTVLKSFNHLLHRNKKVDFIEQFNEKLLVKQENENLQILDVTVSSLFLYQSSSKLGDSPVSEMSICRYLGPEFSNNGSKQNRFYNSIGIYLSIWATIVFDVSESFSGSLELSRWISHIIWGSPLVAPRLQYE